jgi:ATPase components of various ABC-type transport systems, contain duplicated ATPase
VKNIFQDQFQGLEEEFSLCLFIIIKDKASMKNTVVSIKNLLKQFPVGGDFFTALKDVNLQLNEGEFLGLVGPSGSGKNNVI